MLLLPRKTALRPVLALGAAALLLTACSTPPWQESSTATPAGTPSVSSVRPSASPSGPASPSASATISTVKSDLASGSAHRTLTAGSITVKVDYWSTLDMGSWSPEANKPLSMSVTASLPKGTPAKQAVYLSKVTLTPTVRAGDTVATAPGPLSDAATVRPGYSVRRPSSFQQVFSIPALDPAATSLEVQINYELLLQTAPGSKEYAKQTASDSLTIALA